MKKKIFVLASFITIVILFMYMTGYYLLNPAPIHFSISTKPSKQLWDSAEQVSQLKRIVNTPYVYIDATLRHEEDDEYIVGTRYKQMAVIDTRSSQKVLTISYVEHYGSGDEWLHYQNSVLWQELLNDQNQPLFIANTSVHQNALGMNDFLPREYYEKYFEHEQELKTTFLLDGKRLNFNLPNQLYPIEGSNRFYQPNTTDGVLTEFSIQNNQIQISNEWMIAKCRNLYPQIMTFAPHHFIVKEPCIDRYGYSVYSLKQKEKVHYFTGEELYDLKQAADPYQRGTISFLQSRGNTENPQLIFLSDGRKRFSVYEFDHHKLMEGEFDELFSLVAIDLNNAPFITMNENNVLFSIRQPRLDQKPQLFYLQRQMDKNGKLGMFGQNYIEVEFPDFLEQVSWYPYDDTNMLLYGNNALWTMKYDGSELVQIFPKVRE